MSDLTNAIAASEAEWQAKYGKCAMCHSDQPDNKGFHHYYGKSYLCGNVEGCTLCHGCLPPGEVCQACHRANVYQHEC